MGARSRLKRTAILAVTKISRFLRAVKNAQRLVRRLKASFNNLPSCFIDLGASSQELQHFVEPAFQARIRFPMFKG